MARAGATMAVPGAEMVSVLAIVGCSGQTLAPATNVTSNSATLNGSVQCDARREGPIWWELREAGSHRTG